MAELSATFSWPSGAMASGWTGASSDGAGMRDGNVHDQVSCFNGATFAEDMWITADLGEVQSVLGRVGIGACDGTAGAAAADINGCALQTSVDGSSYTTELTIAGLIDGETRLSLIHI